MTVLVTGANGFVGRWVVRALLAAGHVVVAAAGPGGAEAAPIAAAGSLRWLPLELGDLASIDAVVDAERFDAVIHLAGQASGAAALRDPGAAWTINAAGTARLAGALGRRRTAEADGFDPLFLLVSTAEVYGAGPERPRVETDPTAPRSPYAASKLGAEIAARETAARTGVRLVVARAFPHTGPGQDERFVAPSFARRLRLARAAKARVVNVGNLDVVRDFLDVRDVAAAYLALLARGTAGETYNVASGAGIRLDDLFRRLAAVVGVDAIPETDPAFMRPADLPHLVGDPARLRAATGWTPRFTLEETLRDLVDAQAH